MLNFPRYHGRADTAHCGELYAAFTKEMVRAGQNHYRAEEIHVLAGTFGMLQDNHCHLFLLTAPHNGMHTSWLMSAGNRQKMKDIISEGPFTHVFDL